jgi:hypothetical protein
LPIFSTLFTFPPEEVTGGFQRGNQLVLLLFHHVGADDKHQFISAIHFLSTFHPPRSIFNVGARGRGRLARGF